MQTRLVIAIAILGLVLSLGALTTLYSQNTFAQNSNIGSANGGISGAVGTSSGTGVYNSNGGFALGGVAQSAGGGGSGGAMTGGGSTGQSVGGGGSGGAMTGGGSTGQSVGTGQSVDRHLFCNTGVITPICK